MTADDRVLQKTPLTFDVSVWELFWPLLAGAVLVMAPPGGTGTGVLAESIAATSGHRGAFCAVDAGGVAGGAGGGGVRVVRRVVCSGEALRGELRSGVWSGCRVAELHNLYGPTEAAVDVTAWRCRRGVGGRGADREADCEHAGVCVGSAGGAGAGGGGGGVVCGGGGVGAGVSGAAGVDGGAVRGGSVRRARGRGCIGRGIVVRWLAGGELEFLGRADDQVKVRGYPDRVGGDRGGVGAHAGVRRVRWWWRGSGRRGAALVAYVVPAGGAAVDGAELRESCVGGVPGYMVPSVFVVLEELPLLPSGKVDRRALPVPDGGRPELGVGFEAPRSDSERVLASIWVEVLGVDRVGVFDDFFELGGDSILSMQVVAQVEEQTGVRIELPDLFAHPTLEEAAALVDRESDDSSLAEDELLSLIEGLSAEEAAALLDAGAGIVDLLPGDGVRGTRTEDQ